MDFLQFLCKLRILIDKKADFEKKLGFSDEKHHKRIFFAYFSRHFWLSIQKECILMLYSCEFAYIYSHKKYFH